MGNIKEFMEKTKREIMEMMPPELMKDIVIEENTVTKVNDQVLH